ncbi:hypothetical protein JCM11641_006493 [Rhodosporidiobolus odoratus]
MRDPRLSSAAASSSSSRPAHQDVLSSSSRSYAPAQPRYQPYMASHAGAASPSTSSHLSSRTQEPYLQPFGDHPQYYYDPVRQQTFLAVPVEDVPGSQSQAQPQLQMRQPSPPPPAPRPQPAPPVHRVYVLRCNSCETFLSDRGMRAVLLLKPHIVLFSTDAMPTNTETYMSSSDESGYEEEQVERTCECLTSSLNCHGCGRTVGYHIVSPCIKCNASVQKHQRSANHHRYVFHHNEVRAEERRYYPGEKGVLNPVIRSGSPSPSSSSSSSRGSSPAPIIETDKDGNRFSSSSSATAAAARSRRRSPTPHAVSGGGGRGGEERTWLLKMGDTVYWHHLVAGGERCTPVDPRERNYCGRGVGVERSGR